MAVLTRARSERERAETDRAIERAQDVAVHDALTGLTNRRGLALLGGQILESARRRGDAVYCIFVDVDGLSRVNEELGHGAGDDVLLTVAEGLRRSTRATDAVARWGDDEFVVVGPGTGLAPLEMERRIRAHCVEHTSIDRRIWQARVSAGGSVSSSRAAAVRTSRCCAWRTARCTCGGPCAARPVRRRTGRPGSSRARSDRIRATPAAGRAEPALR